MKKIYSVSLVACLFIFGCKKSNLSEDNIVSIKNLSQSVSQNLKSFTDFLETKKKPNHSGKYAYNTSGYEVLQVLPIGVEQYVATLDEPSYTHYYQIHDVMEETPVVEELDDEIDPNLTPAQAAYEIRNSMNSVINIQNFTTELPSEDIAISHNLEILQSNLVDVANDELDRIMEMQESDIVDENLIESQMETRLRNRVLACINDHVSFTNYNIGLTQNQKTSIAVSALYAMETVQNTSLMNDISIAVNNSLSEASISALHQSTQKTFGLFSKVGKFLKKVVKSIAVVAWSAVVIAGSVIVATIMDDRNTPEMVTNTRAAIGLLAGISYVASNSKKWWRWALS